MSDLDPILKRLLAGAYLKGFGDLHTLSPEQMRRYLSHPNPKIQNQSYQDFKVNEVVHFRSYKPTSTSAQQILPAVIYIPATAFFIDRLDASNHYCQLLADNLQMKIISLSHRLVPEHQFPTFLFDCLESIHWIADRSKKLFIEADKITLWGESSGASLAASLTHLLRDEKNSIIKHQTLFYPMVDLVTPFPSKKQYAYGYMLDHSFTRWLEDHALKQHQDKGDPLISPLRSASFENLPPATVITAQLDPLRDEGNAYANRLKEANIPVAFRECEGMIHGFMRFYRKLPMAQQAMQFACQALKASLSPYSLCP